MRWTNAWQRMGGRGVGWGRSTRWRRYSQNAGGRTRAEEVAALRSRNRNLAIYMLSVAVFTLGATYAAVPLYRMFCQATGYGGSVGDDSRTGHKKLGDRAKKVATEEADEDSRLLRISFMADTAAGMAWDFFPTQPEVNLKVGDTALAFYTAENRADHGVTGVASYNVMPAKAGVYFNKVQCFCFDEQRLRAHERVDMPVFFYIDPDFADDPRMDDVREITLSYTFFPSDSSAEDEDGEYDRPAAAEEDEGATTKQ